MQRYRCRVSNAEGYVETIVRAAADRHELLRDIANDGLFAIRIDELRAGTEASHPRALKPSLVTTFIQSLSHLVSSGLTLRDAFDVGRTTFDKETLRMYSAELEEQISKGASLGEAVDATSYVLPPIVVSLLRIGDRIGSLTEILPRLSHYMLESKRIRDKVRGALIYPALVLSVAFIGMVGISVFVLPRMTRAFTAVGDAATESIRRVLDTTTALAVAFPIVVISILLLVLLGIAFTRISPSWRRSIDTWMLRLPVLGSFVANRESLLFCFAMEVLADGGVTISEGMSEASIVVSNTAYRQAIESARNDLINGIVISEAFSRHQEIPARMKAWISIGERTGRVQQVFTQLRSYYQYELERWADRFISLVEPALILVVGVVMLCLVVFFVIPLFSAMGNIVF